MRSNRTAGVVKLVDPSGGSSRTGALDSKYIVYGLFCVRDKTVYIGQTADLVRRMREHQLGKVSYTRSRKPLKLIYTEVVRNREEALAREKFLKSRTGRRYLKKILHQ